MGASRLYVVILDSKQYIDEDIVSKYGLQPGDKTSAGYVICKDEENG